MMHTDIKAFKLNGELAESSNKVTQREKLLHVLETIIRDRGYVPSLDNDTWFVLTYDDKTPAFVFEAGMHGIYIGKEKSWQTSGVTNGKLIPMASPRNI